MGKQIAIDIRHLTHPQLSGVGLYTLNLLRVLSRIANDDEHFLLFATGSKKTLTRLPPLPTRNMTLVTRTIPNRLLFAALRMPYGPTLESFFDIPPDCWWFPDPNVIRTNLPYALTLHDLSIDIFSHFFTAKDKLRHRVANVPKLAKNATRVLAVSQSTALDATARWGVNTNRIDIIPLGVNAQYTPHIAPSDKNYQRGYGLSSPYILFLATLEPRKNIESVIEAYDAFRAKTPHAPRLVIAGGDGWQNRNIKTVMRTATHRADISFLGYIHEKHKPAIYRGATAFVFPSFYEGFGLPVLEAMACGIPVITSFTSSLPEVAGNAAIFVDPLNVTDLTMAITQLFHPETGASLRTLLSKRGIAQSRQFSWEKTAELTLNALRTI